MQRALPTGGVQLALVPHDRARVLVNVPWLSWVAGLRYLALHGVVPIAELALPGVGLGEVDPGKMADDFARGTVEHLRTRRLIDAPPNHEFWPALRRVAGESFYVGWFAARRGK
jgi:hypothetical protein